MNVGHQTKEGNEKNIVHHICSQKIKNHFFTYNDFNKLPNPRTGLIFLLRDKD